MQVKLKSMKNSQKKMKSNKSNNNNSNNNNNTNNDAVEVDSSSDSSVQFMEKKIALKTNKYNQKQRQLQDVVDYIRVVQSSIESMEHMLENHVLKQSQKRDHQLKVSSDQVKQLESQLKKRERQLVEQAKFISEFNEHVQLHVCVTRYV